MSAQLEDIRPGDVVATSDGSEYEVVEVDLGARAVGLWSVNDGETFWTDEHVVRLGDSYYWEHEDGEHIDESEPGCEFCQDLYDEREPDDEPEPTCAACRGTVVASVYGGLVHADPADEMHHAVDLGGEPDPGVFGPCQCDTCRAEAESTCWCTRLGGIDIGPGHNPSDHPAVRS